MNETGLTGSLGWQGISTIFTAVIGIALFVLMTYLIPKLINRFSPHIDEEAEIARGNRAVAEYFGRVVSAFILGISIIVATAIYVGSQ